MKPFTFLARPYHAVVAVSLRPWHAFVFLHCPYIYIQSKGKPPVSLGPRVNDLQQRQESRGKRASPPSRASAFADKQPHTAVLSFAGIVKRLGLSARKVQHRG